MTKNFLKNDVVHHLKNMMQSRVKRPLLKVGLLCQFDTSRILNDGTTSSCNPFLPNWKIRPIDLNLIERKQL